MAMTMRLEVTLEGTPDGELGVVGSDPIFGEWDVSKAIKFTSSQESASTYTAEMGVPVAESEFKLLILQGGAAASWEPLVDNRRFPSRGLGKGCVLRMQYGAPRIAIEVSPDMIEANARATRKLEERQGSALQANVDRKGENAYYFAHTRQFEVPEHAKVITGPGLITGGQPVLIEAGTIVDASEEDRTVWLKDYSWSDSTGKVKVYVPVPDGLLPAEGAESIVLAEFTQTQVDLTVNCKPRQKLKIEKLNGELNVDACSTRVEAHKNRIVLQLAKKRETAWYNLTKK